MVIKLKSEIFDDGEVIPKKYTCDNVDISPPLHWSPIPEHTISFAIICEDPDAPGGTWTHWVLFNIPADVTKLDTGITTEKMLENGAKQGINDSGRIGYGGPCPPVGPAHRYFFKIYALDTTLNLDSGATKEQVLNAMWGNVLDEGQLMGIYRR